MRPQRNILSILGGGWTGNGQYRPPNGCVILLGGGGGRWEVYERSEAPLMMLLLLQLMLGQPVVAISIPVTITGHGEVVRQTQWQLLWH